MRFCDSTVSSLLYPDSQRGLGLVCFSWRRQVLLQQERDLGALCGRWKQRSRPREPKGWGRVRFGGGLWDRNHTACPRAPEGLEVNTGPHGAQETTGYPEQQPELPGELPLRRAEPRLRALQGEGVVRLLARQRPSRFSFLCSYSPPLAPARHVFPSQGNYCTSARVQARMPRGSTVSGSENVLPLREGLMSVPPGAEGPLQSPGRGPRLQG